MQQGAGGFNKVVGIQCGNYQAASSIAPGLPKGRNAGIEKSVTESLTSHDHQGGFAQLCSTLQV